MIYFTAIESCLYEWYAYTNNSELIVNMPECVYNCNFYIIVIFFMTKAANLWKTRNAFRLYF